MTRRFAAPALLLAALAALASPGRGEEPLLLLRAGRAILGDGTSLAPAAVLVRGEWIEEVAGEIEAPPGALVVSVPDGVVTPGFVDAHAWLDLEAALSEPGRAATPAFRAADAMDPSSPGLRRERASGVTAFLLAPSDANVVGGRPALLLADARATPLRATLGRKVALAVPALRPDRFPVTHWGALQVIGDPRALFREGPVLVRARTTGDLGAACRLARRRREGDPPPVLVGAEYAYRMLDEVVSTGAPVVWGPASPDDLPRALATPARLHGKGVPLAFGTGGSPGSLRRTAILAHRAGLPREAALAALTSGAASILGEGERLGRVAKGARADLAVFSGDPLDLESRTLHLFVGGSEVPLREEDR